MSPKNISIRPLVSEELLRRIEGEYLEMAALRLTPAQASRLWGVDVLMSEAMLDALVGIGFLIRSREGAYSRRDQN